MWCTENNLLLNTEKCSFQKNFRQLRIVSIEILQIEVTNQSKTYQLGRVRENQG